MFVMKKLVYYRIIYRSRVYIEDISIDISLFTIRNLLII